MSLCLYTAAPEITQFSGGPCDDPDTLQVLSNENDLLVCSAFGIPPPNVTLIFKNSIVVSLTKLFKAITDLHPYCL